MGQEARRKPDPLAGMNYVDLWALSDADLNKAIEVWEEEERKLQASYGFGITVYMEEKRRRQADRLVNQVRWLAWASAVVAGASLIVAIMSVVVVAGR